MKHGTASSRSMRVTQPATSMFGAGFAPAGRGAVWPFTSPGSSSLTALGVGLALGLLSALLLDGPVAIAVQTLPTPLVRAAAWVTVLGLSNYMLVISAAVFIAASIAIRKEWRPDLQMAFRLLRERTLFFFVAVAGSGLVAQLIKHLVGRARPKLLESVGAFHFDLFSIKASLASFPSGHATSAFAAAAALGVILPRWRVPLFGLATLIAVSRVIVGAHYASDVVCGAVLGLVFTLWLAGFLARKGWTFERRGAALVLKGDGAVGPAFRVFIRSESAA